MTGAVLVVDDTPTLADGYATRLSDEYRVLVAYSGHDALTLVDAESPDVVLLDRRMPDLDGDEVLARLQERASPPRVAMLTGVEPSADVSSMAFDAYLVKPVSPGELHETVASLLDRTTYEHRLQEYFSLASRIAVLETEADPAALRRDVRYWRLQDRRRRLERSLDDRLDALGTDSYELVLGDTV